MTVFFLNSGDIEILCTSSNSSIQLLVLNKLLHEALHLPLTEFRRGVYFGWIKTTHLPYCWVFQRTFILELLHYLNQPLHALCSELKNGTLSSCLILFLKFLTQGMRIN